MWIGIAVEGNIPWPATDTTVTYQGHDVLLRAATETTAPSVELMFEPPMTGDEAGFFLRRFMSSLAWVKGNAVREIFSIQSGRRAGFGKSQTKVVPAARFEADYLPAPADPKAKLALSLYREALGLNSLPYQFLGFFKIINVLYSSGKEQKDWIARALPDITDHQATAQLRRLRVAMPNPEAVAAYLYASGRCAIAHAHANPIVDPDKLEDRQRLSADLPVIKALAEYLVEHELGISSQVTIWREHLYELDGFGEIIDPDLLSDLKNGGSPAIDQLPRLPRLSVRLRYCEPFPAFEGLVPEFAEPHAGCLIVICSSEMIDLRLTLTLHFARERLLFEPARDIRIDDDGSSSAVAAELDRIKLISGLLGNDQLEVWQLDPEKLLGRCDPHIPLNVDVDATHEVLRRVSRELEAELARRDDAT